MDRNSLLELRKRIVQSAQELALNGKGAPESRLQVLLELIRSRDASKEIYDQAYELATRQDDDDAKLDGLLELLFELDQALAGKEGRNEENRASLDAAIEPVEESTNEQAQPEHSPENGQY